MLTAPKPRLLLAGGAAIALCAAGAIALAAFVPGDAAVDEMLTASVAPPLPVVVPKVPALLPDRPASAQQPQSAKASTASLAFRGVLDLLAAGEHDVAFERAAVLADSAERRAIQWAAIYYGGGRVAAANVRRFIDDAPDFTLGTVFRTRLEQALVRERQSGAEMIAELGGAMPATIAARIALASAYLADGQRDRAAAIARSIWVDNFLDPSTEKYVLDRLGSLLDSDAHWDRAVHLMMHDRATAVERLMQFLTPAQKTLAIARNAVSRNAANAKKLLDSVDPALQSHPVYLFSRAQRARQFELWDDAIAFLDKATGDVPDAAEFGFERRQLTRQLIALGEVRRAYLASAGYTSGPDGRVVDAQFHAGWIALSFLRDAKAAIGHFEAMRERATLPDSITQSNYWLGRALTAEGDTAGAQAAFERAAEFGTVFYGQLALAALGQQRVEIRPMPEWQSEELAFEALDTVRAVRLLADNGHRDMAIQLLRSFAHEFQSGAELFLAARLAQSLNAHHLTITIADTAERRGYPLDLMSFPADGVPSERLAAVDVAAVFAVARQESRFQIDAVSSAGARGLMQLMPATARETAGKIGIDYSPSRLTTDAEYNALLGSTYLKAQLEAFDGSLVLAAAAYNAGAGNARKWIRTYGDPRSEAIDPVVWIELIPMLETRTYVKRVVGNYLVYRARMDRNDIGIEQALRQIPIE